MDESLYDEFGNFIGTIDSDAESEVSQDDLGAHADAYLQEDEDGEEEEEAAEDLMQVDGNNFERFVLTEETPSNAIILHEDKQYYPSADQVFGPDVEVLVQEEDTQPLTEPIVAPIKVKSFAIEEKDLPPVRYSRDYLAQLTRSPDTVRNVALVGHLHHGKTGLIDVLVNETHVLPPIRQTKEDSRLRYTDTHVLERARGVSIKSTPITLLLPNLKGKSHVFNFIDTPGHVNFEDEIAAAIRLTDGIVLVVDVIEGVMINTEKIVRHAIAEGQKIVLVLNKMDRLILELKIPPQDAYFKLRHTIEEVNTIISSCGSNQRLSPELGNVVFASAQQGWSFTLASFAKIYGRSTKSTAWDEEAFMQRLWGDIFFNPETRKFQRKQRDTQAIRGFVYFILEPLYKLYAQTIGEDMPTLKKTLQSLRIYVKDNVYKMDSRDLLQIVCREFFGNSAGLVSAILQHIPSPAENARNKVERTYTGPLDGDLGKSLTTCDPEGPLVVHVTKLYSSTDARTFSAFGRVMSGTLRKGDKVRVLGEGYSLDDEEQSEDEIVGDLFFPGGRYRVTINEVTAGNLILIEDVDKSIFKTATIVTRQLEEDAYIFRPLAHFTQSVFKIAIEPSNPSELPKMTAGLRSVNKSYPLLETRIEESGEHVLFGTGELYMDCVMHDLRVLYAEIDIKVSDPVSRFCETVVETSALKCYAETPNKRNKITMIAEPLDKGIAEDIETGRVSIKQPARLVGKYFQDNYNWDLLASRNIWAFGPSDNGPNILVNDTIPSEVDKTLLNSIRENVKQGFQWATREGPLCDEPVRNVKFRLLDATIADQAIYRGGGQIIPTARRAAYSSFLTATPRLMEPVYSVEVQAPSDCVSTVYSVITKRRGHVVHDSPKAGSPLYTVKGFIPVIDSVGFESDIRLSTQGQSFVQQIFDHWEIVPGDPLDTTQKVKPLTPAMGQQIARDFCIKTRRRKGLNVDVSATRYMDKEMVEAMAQLDLLKEGATGFS